MLNNPIPKFKCQCGYEVNTTSETKGQAVPQVGDISICLNCARLHLFNKDLTLRLPTDSELESLQKSPLWPNIQKGQLAVYKTIKKSLIR